VAKPKIVYSCTECGGQTLKWQGQCPHCNAWNTLVESIADKGGARYQGLAESSRVQTLGEVSAVEEPRRETGVGELDRVLGGGLVRGGVTLLGGDPGIGKSTLLLQALSLLSTSCKALYVSGEESAQQVALRSRRLGLECKDLQVLAEIQLEKVLATLASEKPDVAVIDSIQTVYSEALQSAPGSVAQVRECAAQLTRFAKTSGTALLLVGHVTKEGAIAGPRVLEHLVDAVLYLEGDRYHQFRILRGVKNRFGSTNEIGVFEMDNAGLAEVRHPSEAFVTDRNANAAGSVVTVTLEGTRPILIELQALVAPSALENPRRVVSGVDLNRIHLLAAVLQKRASLSLGSQDIFVNVVGGLRVDEPAIDLALALAIASSLKERPVDLRTAAIGEIGLSGEIRAISQLERRLSEAQRLGYRRAIVPATLGRRSGDLPSGIDVVRAQTVREAINAGLSD
jgi:DNA repair protein RadA/Sms